MKKKLLYIWLVCALAYPVFISCSDDDTPKKEDIGMTDSGEVYYLQNSLVKVDENGKFLYRICGEPLDDADTTKLYLGVKDLAEARTQFRKFFPETTSFEQSGNKMVARLKNNAGTVTLVETQGEDEIAHVEFAVVPSLHLVSSLHFLNENAWPDNDESMFVKGDVVNWTDGKYVCIRTKGKGKPSLFFHIASKRKAYSINYKNDVLVKESNVTEAEAYDIRDALLADDGKAFIGFQDDCQKAGFSLEKEEKYFINVMARSDGGDPKFYTIDLNDGKLEKQKAKAEFRVWRSFTINK